MNDFLWILQTNGIKDCPVTVRVAEVALKVWGRNIADQGKDYSQSGEVGQSRGSCGNTKGDDCHA
jgi:hypothetical protein